MLQLMADCTTCVTVKRTRIVTVPVYIYRNIYRNEMKEMSLILLHPQYSCGQRMAHIHKMTVGPAGPVRPVDYEQHKSGQTLESQKHLPQQPSLLVALNMPS